MKANNPVHKPEVLNKIKESSRKLADNLRKVRGGNGQYTEPQLLLNKYLGWPMEYPIATGNPKWVTAVPDLANPHLKIAIEVDGSSHNSPKQRNIDRKKEKMLADLGWIVLRFKNKEVMEQTDRVLKKIEQVVKSRSSR